MFKAKKAAALMVTLAMCIYFTNPFTANSAEPPNDTTYDEPNAWSEMDKSEARRKYEQLLNENLSGGELRERFNALFGAGYSSDDILNHCDEIFDTPRVEIDEGILKLLTLNRYDDNETQDKTENEILLRIPPLEAAYAPDVEAVMPSIEQDEQGESNELMQDSISANTPQDSVTSNGWESDPPTAGDAGTSISSTSAMGESEDSAKEETNSNASNSTAVLQDDSSAGGSDANSSLSHSGSEEVSSGHVIEEHVDAVESVDKLQSDEPPTSEDGGSSETQEAIPSTESSTLTNATSEETYLESTLVENSIATSESLSNGQSEESYSSGNVSVELTLVETTMNSITFGAMFDPAIDINNYIKYYDYGKQEWITIRGLDSGVQATNEQIVLNNLSPDTRYALLIAAYDLNAQEWRKERIETYTQPDPEAPTNATITLKEKSETSITVDVTYPYSKKFGNQLLVNTFGAHSVDDAYIELTDTPYGESKSYTVSGLTPEATYEFIALTQSASGEVYTETVEFKTEYQAPNYQSFAGSHVTLTLEGQQVGLFNEAMLAKIVSRADFFYNNIQNFLPVPPPFGGEMIHIEPDRTLDVTDIEASAGNPIKWNSKYIPRAAIRANYRNNDIVEVLFHELGHNFDSWKWSFEPEALTYLFTYYVIENNNLGMVDGGFGNAIYVGADLKTYYKSVVRRMRGRVNYDESIAKGKYSPYGLAYNLAKVADVIGWEAFEQAFDYMYSLSAQDVPSTAIRKFNMFISLLRHYSSVDILSMFTSNELDVYEKELGGPIGYISFEGIDNVTITGRLLFNLYNNASETPTPSSLTGHPVSLYRMVGDAPSNYDVLLATTTTDGRGAFSIIAEDALNVNLYPDLKVYLSATADNMFGSVTDIVDKEIYVWRSDVISGFSSNTYLLNNIVMDNDRASEAAFNVLFWLGNANRTYLMPTGQTLPKAIARFELGHPSGTYCNVSGDVHDIYLGANSSESHGELQNYFDASVISHEYGHFVMASLTSRYPPNAGGTHYLNALCSSENQAYSEGFANFYSAISHSALYRDFYADGYFFGIDVENANYITSTTSPAKIGAFNPFPDNMKAEALVAAAMYDLWDGKNEAHDIVELDKFYLMFLVEYANNTFTDYINRVFNPKIAKNQEREIWHVLDEYHVSCDKELPQATAEVSNNDIVLTYSDNVSVEKIEVYVDGVLTQTVAPISKSGSLTIAKPSNTREDAQIAFKVYDCQGLNAQRLPSGRTDAYLLVEMQ